MELPKKFTITRNNWRNAGHGRGKICLLNIEGFMCCLGQIESQCGMPDGGLLSYALPNNVCNVNTEEFLWCERRRLEGGYALTPLASMAVNINDDVNLADEVREKKLAELFKAAGYEIEFVGEYIK